jgi:hypothetical protein
MSMRLPSRVPPNAVAFIADVECDGIQRSNYLMHVFGASDLVALQYVPFDCCGAGSWMLDKVNWLW